jgi:hypothetical protein
VCLKFGNLKIRKFEKRFAEGVMILMVTSAKAGQEWAAILESALSESVELAESVRKAASLARNNDYTAVVLDDPMVETELEALDTLLHNSGMAVPVYVNMAICSADRMVREVKSALRRHNEARLVAIRAAESLLRSEIRDAITGILLSSELALKVPELPYDAEEKLKSVCHLASQIRSRLEVVQ